MRVQIAQPGATSQQIEAYLRSAFPRYTVVTRGGMPLVGNGAATGVLVKPSGPQHVTLVWAFPSMGAQMAVTLSIVLTGILPGLLLFLIVWLSVKGGVERLRNEVAAALQGNAPAQLPAPAAAVSAAAGAPSGPVDAGPFALIGAIACAVIGLLSIGELFFFIGAPGVGIASGLMWIVMGVGAFMINAEDKSGPLGPGQLVMAIGAILLALTGLPHVFNMHGYFFVRALVSTLLFLGVGGMLIAAHGKKVRAGRGPLAKVAAGALVLLGLLGFYDVYMFLDAGLDFGVGVVAMIVRALLLLAAAGAVLGRSFKLAKLPVDVPVPAPQPTPYGYAQQQGYPQTQGYPQQPQQQYPQQQYPQQGYPPPGGWLPGSSGQQ